MNDMIGLYKPSERSNTPVVIQDCTLSSRVWYRDVTIFYPIFKFLKDLKFLLKFIVPLMW